MKSHNKNNNDNYDNNFIITIINIYGTYNINNTHQTNWKPNLGNRLRNHALRMWEAPPILQPSVGQLFPLWLGGCIDLLLKVLFLLDRDEIREVIRCTWSLVARVRFMSVANVMEHHVSEVVMIIIMKGYVVIWSNHCEF